MKILTTALLAAGAATCGAASAGDHMSAQPELEFTVQESVPADSAEGIRLDRVGPGEAVLAGVISTPTPCYEIAGALAADGDTLTVTVTATALPRICAQVVAAFAYEARVHRLAAGSYQIRVAYAYPSAGWEEREYVLRVEVPEG